jgi:hypothetical protein
MGAYGCNIGGIEMDAAITKILQKASENPEYQALANYLMSRRAMPQMQREYLGENTLGSFVTPGLFGSGKIPDRGILKLNRFSEYQNPNDVVPTVSHEMTHAAERQMIRQYYEIKAKPNKSELETQFIDNFQKIIGSSKPEIANWLKTIAPEYAKQGEGYRSTSTEALAFGLQNAAYDNTGSQRFAPEHIDPTIATSLMLLLDQAQRVQNQQPASQGR